jgi:hypothetical protein
MSNIRDQIAEMNPDAILWEGFDAAIAGIAERCSKQPLVVYDWDRCIKVLTDDGLSYEEAVEYLDFNVIGAWVGEHTPLMMRKLEEDA